MRSRSQAIPPSPRLARGDCFYGLPIAALLIALAFLVYLPGLGGPFLFDDTPNIVSPLRAWLDGRSSGIEFVFGNQSGVLGRVVSMLSFAANGATTGLVTWPFKLTNLIIHVACGGLIYLLLKRLFRRDVGLNTITRVAAGLIAAVWLLHPLQVSTVLYVVQRMAQLSALFTLLALLAFVSGREALDAGRVRAGCWQLFALVLLATLLAMGSKENGALVPLLCAVIELAWFRPRRHLVQSVHSANLARRLFLCGFIVSPLIVAVLFLLAQPDFFLHGYDGRTFTLGERLLSESRALIDYVGILLLPRGAALGLYTDDFPVSQGLLTPPSTLWAIVVLGAWMVVSIKLRRRVPAFFGGTWLFFCAHALESTIFPLEIYFEHRNYLPSIGVFVALAGLLGWALPPLRARLPARSRTWPFATAAVLGVGLLATATAVRSQVWSTWVGIAEQGVQQHPLSRRALLDKISILLAIDQPEEARKLLQKMLHFPEPAAQTAAAFNLAWLDCRERHAIAPEELANLKQLIGHKMELAAVFGSEKLGNLLLQEDCAGLSRHELAMILRDMTAATDQPPGDIPVWRPRFMAARLFAEDHSLRLAIEQAALAWMTGRADPAVGVYLINLYYAVGDRTSAEILLPQVRAIISPWDKRNQEQLAKVLGYYADPETTSVVDPSQSIDPPADDTGHER
ncbi:MAG: hypothetical protein J0H15_01990 [Xanthomonadales bacterium]|nr:hypothetical protein [Xanthomonadales bacterium]